MFQVPRVHRTARSCFLLAAASQLALSGAERDSASLIDLDPLIVTGTLGLTRLSETIAPTLHLSREELDASADLTLGAALQGLPGIHSTAFGAGAGRPVIRGFEGPRVRVLENGLDSADASSLSPDHASALDLSWAEGVDVVRGPATLLYGSPSIGGVVNVRNGLIQSPGDKAASYGRLRAAFTSASQGWDSSAHSGIHAGAWTFAGGGAFRDHADYRIPHSSNAHSHDKEQHGDETREQKPARRLENSFVRSLSGTLGAEWRFADAAQLRTSFFTMERDYGAPGHSHPHEHDHDHEHGDHDHHHDEDAHDDGVVIELRQTRGTLEAELPLRGRYLSSVKLSSRLVNYTHQELQSGETATRFDSESFEGRIELAHQLGAAVHGAWGGHLLHVDLTAEGDEAYVPPSDTRDLALFVLEEWRQGDWRYQFGGRLENRRIRIATDTYDRSTGSLAAGLRTPRIGRFHFSIQLARSQRHPEATELYADGPHAATARYEIGDPTLRPESSWSADLGAQLSTSRTSTRVSFFYHHFDRYITAFPTTAERDHLPLLRYRSTRAEYYGAELESTWHLWHGDASGFHLNATADLVRASNLETGETLPRLPPARLGLSAILELANWTLSAGALRASSQDRTSPHESSTPGYTDVTAELRWNHGNWKISLRGHNLLNDEIRQHSSFIKDIAPAPARHVSFLWLRTF